MTGPKIGPAAQRKPSGARPRAGDYVGWTAERVLEMRGLWREGWSAGQIADRMGGGLTRNAVLGKIHRMGYQTDKRGKGNNPIAQATIAKRNAGRRVVVEKLFRQQRRPFPDTPATELLAPRKAKPAKPVEAPPIAVDDIGGPIEPLPEWAAPADGGVEIGRLEPYHCRFPLWDHSKKIGKFCGRRRVEPLSYCAGHARLAYRPAVGHERRLSNHAYPVNTHKR